ncbi:MAG: UDP-3-O-acyl-N-acetylglucosamine deacetylase [Desulfovibrionaceae bacterium]
MRQTTLQKQVRCKGIGLHSGKKVELALHPAPEGTGILFSIQNGAGSTFLTPNPEMVVTTALATTLGNGSECVSTVEHVLAAIMGMGVDNVRIEVIGGELPIMDGSAGPFVYLLKQAGLRRQSKDRRVLKIKTPVVFERDGKRIQASPHDGFTVDYTIDFNHPLIGRQQLAVDIDPDTFAQQVAKARTFGFLREVEYLKANGLANGGSLDNAVVLDDYGVVNSEGLRYADEFVRHKLLDFIGDMAVIGMPVMGRFEIFASGHQLNNQFLRYLYANREIYLEETVLATPQRQGERRKEAESGRDVEVTPSLA